MPKVQSMLKEYFGGKTIKRDINPDEAVAYGAAIQAAMLNEEALSKKLSDLKILDVTPLSLGIEIKDGIMSQIVKRNKRIPLEILSKYTTFMDDQEKLRISVFEGERLFVRDNNLLGEFILHGIKKARAGVPQIQVKFQIDENGILNVSAKDLDTLANGAIQLANIARNLSAEQLEEMAKEAKKWAKMNKEHLIKVQAKNELLDACFKMKAAASELSAVKRKEIETKVENTLNWIGQSLTEIELDEILHRLHQINNLDIHILSV